VHTNAPKGGNSWRLVHPNGLKGGNSWRLVHPNGPKGGNSWRLVHPLAFDGWSFGSHRGGVGVHERFVEGNPCELFND
jgi:hypothetical protein